MTKPNHHNPLARPVAAPACAPRRKEGAASRGSGARPRQGGVVSRGSRARPLISAWLAAGLALGLAAVSLGPDTPEASAIPAPAAASIQAASATPAHGGVAATPQPASAAPAAASIPVPAEAGGKATVGVMGKRLDSQAHKVVKVVNAERRKLGLKPVKMDRDLLERAMKRAGEIAVRWGHVRPDGSTWASMIPRRHQTRWWAENIAAGQPNARRAMKAWMKSDSHRPHIVDRRARSIGIGAMKVGSTIYWVQLFSASKPRAARRTADAATVTDVKFTTDGYSLTLTANPKGTLAVGQTAKMVARLRGMESFKSAVIAPESLHYTVAPEGVDATVTPAGRLTSQAAGLITVTATVAAAPTLQATTTVPIN
ncbi:MAG: CAP domain-containing protein [Bifidobacteriaceae bacterium]|nr:CAP domain-containing protein [Bifidobacteriaceae bacterium]